MPHPAHIKPTHKAIQAYYDTLRAFSDHYVGHEGAVSSAFQALLADTARSHRWMLVPQQPIRIGGKLVRPDGTLYDEFNLNRGYWEAKDTDDDLNIEIKKKVDKGYPLTNTIFEDTRRAVLFQGKQKVNQFDLTSPQSVADLLNQFYDYTQPEYDNFQEAVAEFKERVPDLARGLADKIQAAHKDNARFGAAFNDFFALCQSALNPNISRAAVDEMLVQHLLTERLIRKIFDNPHFTTRNVIAAEVEKVIAALVSKSFNPDDFQKSLDRFYVAIENAARTMPEFTDKQHFLNTVYERFFQGYSVKLADTHGIIYTPQQMVDFMCASVAEVLQTEFGKSLGDKAVHILDPCTGTANFIVNLLRRIPKKDLPRMYREQLFANEVMLLPYYIAALNIEHAYYELTGEYEPFEGLCFVDTLDLAEQKGTFSFMTEKNTERVERQKKTPITVVIGNPPYNMGQQNENDNNKNRKYEVVDRRIKETYVKDSSATLNNKLYDAYVKFFRWAIDRLHGNDGVICLVTNNSFVDQIAFDGMRKHLLHDFTRIYHLDLHGNVQKNPKLSGTTHNVFGIKVGVGITIAVRAQKAGIHELLYHRVPEGWRKEQKLAWLFRASRPSGVEWEALFPDARHTWLLPENADEFARFLPLGSKATKSGKGTQVGAIFKTYSLGVATNRDVHVYSFDRQQLNAQAQTFIEIYNSAVDVLKRRGQTITAGELVDTNDPRIKWTRQVKAALERHLYSELRGDHLRRCLYRPFTRMWLYFDNFWNEEQYKQRIIFPIRATEAENKVITLTTLGSEKPFMTLVGTSICDLHLVGAGCGAQCFPFYIYGEDGTDRCENITDSALKQFRDHYGDKKLSKWDIFYYVYGLLHHPGYRERFADNLKRELPRIPFAPDFRAFAGAGQELARLHLDYEQIEPYPPKWIETPGVPLSRRVEDKMRLSKDKTQLAVNPSLTLAGIPPEVGQYRLGNRSALHWVIDQYQVKEDKRSGIRSDPNRAEDPEYIIRLVGQVVRVSVETVRIVGGLPHRFSP